MPLLVPAKAIYMGSTAAKAVYLGNTLVWPPGSGNRLTASLKFKSGSTVTASATATGDTPTEFKWYYTTNGTTWTYLASKPTGAAFDYTTSYSTTITMKVEAIYPSPIPKLTATTGSVTIGAAPPPPTQQKVVTLAPLYSATYKENNTQNTYSGAGSTKFMSGRYDSTNGNQKSAFYFGIDESLARGSDMRWCKSIDKVEISVQSDHHYNHSNWVQTYAITHTKRVASDPATNISWATFPGCSGYFGGRTTYEDYWYGAGTATGRQWIDITNDRTPSPASLANVTVAENFRKYGSQGIVLGTTQTSTQYYCYFLNNIQLRITYTVNT